MNRRGFFGRVIGAALALVGLRAVPPDPSQSIRCGEIKTICLSDNWPCEMTSGKYDQYIGDLQQARSLLISLHGKQAEAALRTISSVSDTPAV